MTATSRQVIRKILTAPAHLLESKKAASPKDQRDPKTLSEILKRSKGAYSQSRK
jgi:hypothetical protein